MSDALFATLDERMKKCLAAFREELTTVRTGRASGSLLDHVTVEMYGSHMPLNQLATISVPESRMLTVQPWDKKSLKAIEKAIRESDLGLNPLNDGTLLRIPLPELTEERRKSLVKLVQKYGEQAKIALRNVRRDILEQMKKMEKNKEVSKDDLHAWEKKVQEQTDHFIKEVDDMLAHKESEIMQV
ncbi:ribosome recycling factor [Candidatus Magnetaquicoccus inordinatus]|uniref:ribosome recycling factor n=1 Tax=Candidatus Magnetaquicoccus inordinatus TaxID=2496818 RepID=UPI00102BFD8C|nr:ribosome recycling factor [Candidatus Magnetaquicoccus inordinatus]